MADDLLKNDGKKFIEMMEQLAERRMQREAEASYPAPSNLTQPSMNMPGQNPHAGHNHAPPPEEEDYEEEEEEEEDFDSQEEEDYEEDEMVGFLEWILGDRC